MTYLGNTPGAKGFMFMHSPNNVLFYTTHCIFDESLFPKCPKQAKRQTTRLRELAPKEFTHSEPIPVEEEDDSPGPSSRVRNHMELANDPPSTLAEPPTSMRTPPSRQEPTVPAPVEPVAARPQRQRKVPVRPRNVYGEAHHPVDILKDQKRKGGHAAKGPIENPPEPAAPIPGPSMERLPPVADFPVLSIDPTSSEDEVE